MEKKLRIIFELVFILGAFIYFTIKLVVPDAKEKFGPSDRFINTNSYVNMFEVNIDNNIRYALVVNNEEKVYHLMFFDLKSTCLYNKNIEGSSIEVAVMDSLRIINSKNYIADSSKIILTKYGDEYYDDFLNNFKYYLRRYSNNFSIIEKNNTLSNLRDELQLDYTESDESILKEIDLYSKEYARIRKNSTSKIDDESYINGDNAKTYCNNVYKKLEKYVSSNNIVNMDKNNSLLQVTLIPADDTLKYYPSTNSWYYVKDGKVYAYIEIIDGDITYSYCYNGSIDLNKEGECL